MVGLADSWWFTIRNSNRVSIKFNRNDNVALEIGKRSYKMELDKSKTILALLLGCITLMGTAFSVDARYAKQEQVKKVQESVKKVETRLDNKILKDRGNLLQERIWKYEDRYDGKKMPDTIKEVVRDLQKELDDINKKLDD